MLCFWFCSVTCHTDAALVVQDTTGVGHHGASLTFATTSAGSPAILQEWLTINSIGLASFAGLLLAYCLMRSFSTCPHLSAFTPLLLHAVWLAVAKA